MVVLKRDSLSKPIFINDNKKFLIDPASLIGQGYYALVYKCDFANQPAVIKIPKTVVCDKSRSGKAQMYQQREVDFFKQCITHDHLITLFSVYTSATFTNALVLERWGGTLEVELQQHNNILSPTNIKKICRQLLAAVNCLHENNVAHADIKLDNIMLKIFYGSPYIKLIDFGYCVFKDDVCSVRGAFNYRSPELFACGEHRLSTTFAIFMQADMWAVGVTLFFLCVKFSLLFYQASLADRFNRESMVLSVKDSAVVKFDTDKMHTVLIRDAKQNSPIMSKTKLLQRYMLDLVNTNYAKQNDLNFMINIYLSPMCKRLASLCKSLLTRPKDRLSASQALELLAADNSKQAYSS